MASGLGLDETIFFAPKQEEWQFGKHLNITTGSTFCRRSQLRVHREVRLEAWCESFVNRSSSSQRDRLLSREMPDSTFTLCYIQNGMKKWQCWICGLMYDFMKRLLDENKREIMDLYHEDNLLADRDHWLGSKEFCALKKAKVVRELQLRWGSLRSGRLIMLWSFWSW